MTTVVRPDAQLLNNRLVRPGRPVSRDMSNGAYDVADVDAARALLRRAGVDTPVRVRWAGTLDRDDLATIPLYDRSAIGAWSVRVQGVVLNPGSNGIPWNADTWSVAE